MKLKGQHHKVEKENLILKRFQHTNNTCLKKKKKMKRISNKCMFFTNISVFWISKIK